MNQNIPSTLKGNSARKFFENYEKVAEILELPEFLIKDLGTIWRVLTSGHSIDPEKFGNFCELFNEKFKLDNRINWYQFSPTIHKGGFHILRQHIIEILKV